MASTLPPPGASRPRPPLTPPAVEPAVPTDVAPAPPPARRAADHLPPPEPESAWPNATTESGRPWGFDRWVLMIGYGLVAVALGVIANQAWVVGVPDRWVLAASLVLVPAAVTAGAALFGLRAMHPLAWFSAAWLVVVALVVLVMQPPLGLPIAACAVAAVAVTAAARALAPREDASAPAVEA